MPEFEIFRSKHNADHYVAVLAGDRNGNAIGVRASQNLKPLTRINDAGEPHLGFDVTAAKRAIRDHGFYAFALHVEERDGLQELWI
jgi:hypothetical protein